MAEENLREKARREAAEAVGKIWDDPLIRMFCVELGELRQEPAWGCPSCGLRRGTCGCA